MRKILFCSAILVVAGCSDSTPPPVPASVVVSPGPVSLTHIRNSRVVHAAVSDGKGKAMKNAALNWSSSSPAATVEGLGGDSAKVIAAANGSAVVTAQAGAASGTVEVNVAQAAASANKLDGDSQTGTVGTTLGTPLRVEMRDLLGTPAAGVTVTFAVTSGGGSVSQATAVTGADGIAATTWTLGTTAGSAHTLTASAPGLADAPIFAATATAGPAARGVVHSGSGQSAARESAVPVPPRLVVQDAFGNPVSGVAVRFAVTSGGGSVTGAAQTTGADGQAAAGSWKMGPTMGTNTLAATFPGTALAALEFTATATASAHGSISVLAGNYQSAMIQTEVPTPPSVIVRDPQGAPVPGARVKFSVSSGYGKVTGGTGTAPAFETTVTTDAKGVATLGSWQLGPWTDLNKLGVSGGAGLTRTEVFAAGCSDQGGGAYAITLCFTSFVPASQRVIFERAAAHWATVIRGDLPDVTGTIPAGLCSDKQFGTSMTHDDLVIFASVDEIDGRGKTLGRAGPCFLRAAGNLPLMGVMQFDKADVQVLEYEGWLGSLVLHEIGHVLGIGTLWSEFGLLKSPSSASAPLDTYFSGAGGIAGFNLIGGTAYGGAKVPVENTGGPGTMNGHWRESVLKSELMTGYLAFGKSPLSAVTVRSLEDLGYVVDAGAADGFSLASGASGNRLLNLHNDAYAGPRFTVDRRGRRTRIR